ncbi:Trypanosome variant surface glycoprotein (A-type) [Trypanosoma brucei equiperdum]|uniref:Trypanosome variant surface glycoprotein (A-type) n=1 Tax=Trypanosoma brucei equiperdum TaxID=630700 RepID=A0A3L6LCJ5_9TRYP|nr:Trypanosome variant surface glycoprotein (A-type) [Trypanosoma brucei equiperdum]RHW73528.1 Trypanosome variant surface glycoprotein (A-type) [Trypanosoma brucei equiperdum]RHW73776.1 Trypanosome variant surface glycoprotein (A-type) [Trypanosoma brucei equiperdum]RHW73946.1 Trypanosome variant surface glycoprotein (A-type) [Trypanosoma brucei equiperdum]
MIRGTGPWHHVEVAGIARVLGKNAATESDISSHRETLFGEPTKTKVDDLSKLVDETEIPKGVGGLNKATQLKDISNINELTAILGYYEFEEAKELKDLKQKIKDAEKKKQSSSPQENQKECAEHKNNKKACTGADCIWKGGESEKRECEVNTTKVAEQAKQAGKDGTNDAKSDSKCTGKGQKDCKDGWKLATTLKDLATSRKAMEAKLAESIDQLRTMALQTSVMLERDGKPDGKSHKTGLYYLKYKDQPAEATLFTKQHLEVKKEVRTAPAAGRIDGAGQLLVNASLGSSSGHYCVAQPSTAGSVCTKTHIPDCENSGVTR